MVMMVFVIVQTMLNVMFLGALFVIGWRLRELDRHLGSILVDISLLFHRMMQLEERVVELEMKNDPFVK